MYVRLVAVWQTSKVGHARVDSEETFIAFPVFLRGKQKAIQHFPSMASIMPFSASSQNTNCSADDISCSLVFLAAAISPSLHAAVLLQREHLNMGTNLL